MSSILLLERPEKKPETLPLSVSKVKTFKDCKAKYRFSYIEKLPKKEWDFHVFGKFLHETFERFYKKKLDGSQDPPNICLSASWKEAFGNWKEKLTKDQIAEAKTICGQFLSDLAADKPQPSVIAAEKDFYIDIDGRVLLNGFIDRIQIDADGVLHVSDYKTTKSKRYLKNDYFQLLTYAFVMCLEDPSLKKVRTSYILLRHNMESIVKEFERDEIMSIENTFLEYADSITSEKLFRANPGFLCRYCDFLDSCEPGLRITGKQSMKFGKESW